MSVKVRTCPGCGKLKPEVNLINEVQMYASSRDTYVMIRLCDPCYAAIRDEVASAAGKARKRRVVE